MTGTISLPLQAVAASGNVYRLRNATFTITDNHTGNLVTVFSSEEDPSKSTISKVLDTGDYSITLLQGWFLERVSGSNGTGGAASGGAFNAGGATMIPGKGGSTNGPGGSPGKPLPAAGAAAGGPGKPAQGGAPGAGGSVTAGSAGEAGAVDFPEGGVGGAIDEGFGGFIGFGGRQGTGGFFGSGGSSGGGVGVRVDATLTSNAVQFFSIFSRSDTFVSFSFQIGGEILNFNQGRVNVGIDVVEVGEQCQTPPNVTRPERVLLENDAAAVSGVRLRDVFNALANNGATKGDGELLFNQIYDSFASADLGLIPSAVHCGDEMTNGIPTLNGFPVECNRLERLHVGDIDAFKALAIINRIDLAPENGANCGQQRMIFASNTFNRAFIIVEAQVPNPTPELGIAGCVPLAKFWMAQNDIADPITRGQRLTEAFLKGSPELASQGFGAFYAPENLTVGSGQIRTNQFDSFPWTLREFKLTQDGETLKSIPFPTAEAPNGALWNESSGLPQGAACRDNMLSALDGVLTGDLAQLSFVVDQQCRDAESRNDFSQAYAFQMSPGFRAQIAEKAAGTGLTPEQVANRAQFAGSCIGCHNESSGSDLGLGASAPFSNDFPHVTEFASTDCGTRNAGSLCFPTSTALKDLFLPSRLKTLTDLLQVPIVSDPCGSGGSGGFGSGGGFGTGGGFFGSGGSFGTAGSSFGKGGSSSVPPPPPPKPAPNVVIEVASSGTAIPQLVKEDATIRALSGARTIGGRSAQVTH